MTTDFKDTDQMAQNVWLFLTNGNMPLKATIKKEAFLHEVKAALELTRQHYAKMAWQECDRQHSDRSGHAIPESLFHEWNTKQQKVKP